MRDNNPQELVPVGDSRLGRHRAMLDVRSDPLLWMDSRNALRDPMAGLTSAQLQATRGAAMWRLQAGLMTSALFRRAEVSPVKSVDIGMFVDSSGGSDTSAATIDAIRDIGRMMRAIPSPLWIMLRSMLDDGDWPWKSMEKRERRETYTLIRRGLDHAAVFHGMMASVDFTIRWLDGKTAQQ